MDKSVNNDFQVKNQRKILIIATVLVGVLFFGSSYALLTSKDERVVTVKTGNLSMTYETKPLITLKDELPKNDTDGLNNTPIEINLTNSGNIPIGRYEVKLVKDAGQTSDLGETAIRYAISTDGTSYGAASALSANSNIVFSDTNLAVGGSKKIYLKVWIDEQAGEEILTKNYYGSIEVMLYQK